MIGRLTLLILILVVARPMRSENESTSKVDRYKVFIPLS